MDHRLTEGATNRGWQRVLPVGPHGIQPYVQISCSARGLPAGLQVLIAVLARVARSAMASAHWAATSIAARPMLWATAPRAQG
jgi:hypothetical protein